MKGLGLYDGILAVVVLLAEDERPDTEPVRPFGGGLLAEWERTSLRPGVRALGIVDKYDSEESRALEEDYAVRWATAYPSDIVMVVEVLG